MKAWLGLLIIMLASGCRTSSTEENKTVLEMTDGEACSIKVSGIEFTKSLNNAKAEVEAEIDKLTLTSDAKSDYFNEPDGSASFSNAPVLLTRIDNTQPFTFETKVTPTLTNTYDAGALYMYMNQKWWFKFAFELDERKKKRIVTVRTIETSDDNNHDVADSTSLFMKISSDTKIIGFYYSLDKENWQLVRLFKNDYPKELWLGLSAQSPIGNGNTAIFEACSMSQVSVRDFRLGN